jgi:hypothetical protein
MRRAEFIRANRRTYAVLIGVFVTIGAAASLLMGWLFGPPRGAVMASALVGGSYVLVMLLPDLLDSSSSRMIRGAEGEEATGRELKRLRRQGWQFVHHVPFASGDADHVAIGPGGVVVIESKSRKAELGWLRGTGQLRGWALQAESRALLTHHLIMQVSGLRVETRPLVALWRDGSDPVDESIRNVDLIDGSSLSDRLHRLPRRLDTDQVTQITIALRWAASEMEMYQRQQARQHTADPGVFLPRCPALRDAPEPPDPTSAVMRPPSRPVAAA